MAGTSVPDDEKRRVEAEFMQRLQEQMQQLSVYDHLVGVLQTLSSLAFQHLGVTRETAGQRDLEQSRLAIDAFRALTEVLVPLRPSDEVILYRSTLSQMQLAYVAELERGREPEAAVGDEPPAEPAAPKPSRRRSPSAPLTSPRQPSPTREPEVPDDTDMTARRRDPRHPTIADTVTAAEAGAVPTDEEER